MDRQFIPDSFYQDEVVRLLADRYHTDSTTVIHSFLLQSEKQAAKDADPPEIQLEENEMELLKDLLEYINKQIEI